MISSIDAPAKKIYEDVLLKYREDNWEILSNYFGHFSQDLVNAFSENTEELLYSLSVKKSTVKKVFSILVEGLQNIRFHGEKDQEGKHFGVFIFAFKESNIKILFGSLILNEKISTLKDRLSHLSSMNDEQVKEYYMQVLNNGIISEKGNAGLGFITMRLKSANPLNIHFYPLNEDLNLFSVELLFSKEN
ncbi:MAG: hypothetical protein HYU67_05360 [Flavobacteriia bacterium]|nr:hypothetical protein [Flavobacteriia bacterium]